MASLVTNLTVSRNPRSLRQDDLSWRSCCATTPPKKVLSLKEQRILQTELSQQSFLLTTAETTICLFSLVGGIIVPRCRLTMSGSRSTFTILEWWWWHRCSVRVSFSSFLISICFPLYYPLYSVPHSALTFSAYLMRHNWILQEQSFHKSCYLRIEPREDVTWVQLR